MMEHNLSLRYKNPAKEWTEALPIGNGRLGAMVFGGVQYEREILASASADVIVMRIATTNPRDISFDARLMRSRLCDHGGKIDGETVFLTVLQAQTIVSPSAA
jgi:hypothetical protein